MEGACLLEIAQAAVGFGAAVVGAGPGLFGGGGNGRGGGSGLGRVVGGGVVELVRGSVGVSRKVGGLWWQVYLGGEKGVVQG